MTLRKPAPAAVAGMLALLLCAVASLWLADGVAPWEGDRANLWHHYE